MTLLTSSVFSSFPLFFEKNISLLVHPDFSFGETKDHEKYSVAVSAAIKSSWEAIRAGGGFAAVNVSLRWLMMGVGVEAVLC
jgi:hypothetical protein